ncbi:hypothetical protein BDR04DRAFT_1119385 [Suillus decipiens]|nr:hypothetical protein BDR04DRAFT_1119385 [Suillus decipiens]
MHWLAPYVHISTTIGRCSWTQSMGIWNVQGTGSMSKVTEWSAGVAVQYDTVDWKKIAISIAPSSYSLFPLPSIPPQQCATWVKRATKDLLKGGSFYDSEQTKIQQGKTRPYQITWRQPEKFCMQLPISCLALVATVFHCAFDGLKKNRNSKCYPNFSLKEYSPIYHKLIQIIKDTLKDKYYDPRLLAQLQEWVEVGWAENIKLDSGAAETKHNLQDVLD